MYKNNLLDPFTHKDFFYIKYIVNLSVSETLSVPEYVRFLVIEKLEAYRYLMVYDNYILEKLN